MFLLFPMCIARPRDVHRTSLLGSSVHVPYWTSIGRTFSVHCSRSNSRLIRTSSGPKAAESRTSNFSHTTLFQRLNMKMSIVSGHWRQSNIIPFNLEAILLRKVHVYFTEHIKGLIWLVFQASMHCVRAIQISLFYIQVGKAKKKYI